MTGRAVVLARWSLVPLAVAALLSPAVARATATGQDATVGARPRTPLAAAGVTLSEGRGGQAQAYRLFTRSGANGLEAPQPWSTLEPVPGRYRLGDVRDLVRGVRSVPDDRILLIPAAIETTRRSVPAGLRRLRWDSPRMMASYRRLIDRLAPLLSRQVRYVSIANEADVYLSAHPRQLPAFLHFAAAAIAELHRRVPWAKAGVTVTSTGLVAASPKIAQTLARLGSAAIVTYYPLVGDYRVRSPRSPLHDLPSIVHLAHGHPVVVQEAGYPSSRRLNASPAKQARFVRSVFAAWNHQPRAIPFLSIYTLFDPPSDQCRPQTNQVAFLCSLGLRTYASHAKPAWRQFVAGVHSIHSP